MSDSDTDSPQPQYAIVDVTSGAKVKLTNLNINGDVAQSQFTGCGDDFVGVYYHDASGTMSGDTVTNVELPHGHFGCQDGLGVYVASDAGDTSKVSMSKDSVTAYDKNGITCDDAGTTCTITGSTVTGIGPTGLIAQNGIQFYDAFSGSITDNTVSGDSYTGGTYSAAGLLLISTGSLNVSTNTVSDSDVNIYLGTDGTGLAAGHWSVTGNTVTGATDKVPGGASGFGDGIQLDSTSNAVTISGNNVTGGAENGISVFSATGATLSSNTREPQPGRRDLHRRTGELRPEREHRQHHLRQHGAEERSGRDPGRQLLGLEPVLREHADEERPLRHRRPGYHQHLDREHVHAGRRLEPGGTLLTGQLDVSSRTVAWANLRQPPSGGLRRSVHGQPRRRKSYGGVASHFLRPGSPRTRRIRHRLYETKAATSRQQLSIRPYGPGVAGDRGRTALA